MRADRPDEIRVLHVDDDSALLDLAATFLSRAEGEFTVLTATSAAAGMDRLADERIDCVVSDYDMADTNGLAFLSKVREAYPDLPFILFTGKGSEEIASEAISAGVTDYLQKETGTDQYAVLANRITNVVEARRAETGLRRTEQRYRTLVDTSPVPIVVYDGTGTITEANAAAAEFVGADEPSDLIGELALSFIHPEDREKSRRRVEGVLEEGRAAGAAERRIVDATGNEKHAVLATAPIPIGSERAGQVILQDITDYKDREAALESTSSLLATLVGNVPVGILAEDEQRQVLVTNRQFCDLFDLDVPPESIVGEDCRVAAEGVKHLFSEPERFIETTNEAVEDGRPIDRQEFEFVDGRVIERSSTPMTLEGDAAGYLWVYHDVTERKRAENRFRTLFYNLPDPAVIVELTEDDAIARAVNDAFEAVFGYDAEQTIDASLNELLVPDGLDAEATEIDADARSGEQVVREVQRLTAEGERRDFLFRNVLIEADRDERMAHGIYTDITSRKRRERRLNALHEATRELMGTEAHHEIAEIASDAAVDILALPLNGVHLYDPELDALVPVAISEQTYDVMGEPPTIPAGEGIIWKVYRSGQHVVYGDVREAGNVLNPTTPIRSEFYLPLGDHGVFLAGSTTVDDFEPADVALAKVLSANVEAALDRADRERSLRDRESELERQNGRLESFADVVSHDLRNPLTVARGRLSVARETGGEEHFEAVETAHERMGRLIDDLLTLSRQGRAIGKTESVSITDVARRAWSTVETAGSTVGFEAELTVEADPNRLVQLFENLLGNAVRHGGDGVTVRVGTLPDDAGFFVEDDGTGIPAGRRGQVLESGYSTDADGTGFGLPIVSTIAEAHGWSIRVEESEEGGARIEVLTAPETGRDEE